MLHRLQAALADTDIPKVSMIETDRDEGGEPELDVDDDPEKAMHLDVSDVPVLVTVAHVSRQKK